MNLMGVYLLISQNKKRINIMKLEDYLKEQLKNPEFRKEYETFKSLISSMLTNSKSDDEEALSDEIDIPKLKDI